MATKAGAAYIEIRGEDKRLQGDLNAAHRKVDAAATKMEGRVTKAFKRMALVATAAFAVVAYKTASLVKESALLAARFETLDIVMKQVGKNAGYSAEQMDRYDISLRETGISMIESRNSLARMAQAQLDLSKATQLGRIAQDAAVIGNINSSEAFQRMIYGIQSGNLLVLKTIGINVSFENSYKKVAKATGRAKTSFTQAEKAIIRQNAVIEYGSRIAGTYEAAMTTAGKKLSSFTRYVEDFKVKMGKAFGPATVSLVDAATKAMKEFQEEISKPEAQEALKNLSSQLATAIIQLGQNLPEALKSTMDAIADMQAIYNSLPEGVIGATGVGLIGRILLGSWTGAGFAAGLYLIVQQIENLGVERLAKLWGMPLEEAKKFREELDLVMLKEGTLKIKFDEEGINQFKKMQEMLAKGAPTRLDVALEDPDRFYGKRELAPPAVPETVAVTKEEYKVWEDRSDMQTQMIDEARERQLAYFEKSLGLRRAFSGQDLEAIISAEQAKLDMQFDFDMQYAEMGKSRFDLEMEQLDRWKEAQIAAKIDINKIEELYSRKAIDIAQREQIAKLAIYSNIAGQIAGTFMQIAQAGGKQSKEAFMLYQAFAIAQAGISTAMAYIKTLAEPLLPFPSNVVMANIILGLGAAQIAMIAAAKPPSYETGIDYVPQTGLAMLHEGEQVIPKIKARKEGGKQTIINIILNNPVFQDLETQRQVMAQIASVVATQVAPGAVIENYENDGPIRSMVRGGV